MGQVDQKPDCPGSNWIVYRQDDHGNSFVVATDLSREAAQRMVADYEARGHKQHYWCEAKKC